MKRKTDGDTRKEEKKKNLFILSTLNGKETFSQK